MTAHCKTQLVQGEEVLAPGASVPAPGDPRAPQALDEIVLIDELARILKTSTRTIARQMRAGTFFIPTLPRVDARHRWGRATVSTFIATAHTLVHDAAERRRGLRVVPRKDRGEGAREERQAPRVSR